MNLLFLILFMLPPVLVAVYTVNYGRWAWREKLRRGAIGLYLLALATVATPAFLLWRQR